MIQASGANRAWTMFRVPLAIALLSVIGLLAALTGDGWLDTVSWATLAVPPLVVIWAVFRSYQS